MAKRRTFTADFKAMVVREAMRGERTLRQVAAKHGVHPNQVSRWKREATERLAELFERGTSAGQDERDAQVRKLRRKAEQLVVERDFLKRVWGRSNRDTRSRAGVCRPGRQEILDTGLTRRAPCWAVNGNRLNQERRAETSSPRVSIAAHVEDLTKSLALVDEGRKWPAAGMLRRIRLSTSTELLLQDGRSMAVAPALARMGFRETLSVSVSWRVASGRCMQPQLPGGVMMLADMPRAYRCLIWAVCEAIELACSVQSFDRIVPLRRTSRVIEGLPSKIALRGALWGLFCIVVASGASHAHAQLIGADQVARHARSDTAKAEHESRSLRQSIGAYRRNLAHARMREQVPNASSRLACPVFGAESTPLGPRLPRKRVVAQNLPGVPPRARWQNLARRTESVSSIFAQYISGPVVQSRCINCHVQDGISGHTRIVFSPSSEAGHETGNLAVFEDFVAAVEGGADTILAKVQGVGHGGGIQVPAGSAEFANMERFVRLLGGGLVWWRDLAGDAV